MLAEAVRSTNFVSGFRRLSRNAQLILADCLDRGHPQVTLAANDIHADMLRRLGWLQEVVSMTPQTRTFLVPPQHWYELQSIRDQLLSADMRGELQRLREMRN